MSAFGVGMNKTADTRPRLAAVAFIDIVGYSILMANDSARTHVRWMSLLSNVVQPLAAEHRGRVVKSTGDGILAEFPSAVDAVTWAVAVQHGAAEFAGSADETSILLRISVHLGDVVETSDDIYGDGVNVAARLQEHAEPGGVVISEAIHDLVRGNLPSPARDLGLLRLKNYERSVRVYALALPRGQATAPAQPRVGPLPSIAVLPLKNLGGVEADGYFSAGIVDDIIVSLSGLRELLVIAHSSTVRYQQQDLDVREVGRAFGVHYVMTGSVRRSAKQVRVTVHLCDAQTGVSLWSDATEAPLGELFEVQDRIVSRIVAGIAPHVRSEELRRAMRKRPDNFTAYDFTLRALETVNGLRRETFDKALEYLECAIQEDGNFAMSAAWAARWYSLNIGQGWSKNVQQDLKRASQYASRAIDLDSGNALALATYAHLRSRWFRDYETALQYFDRALATCPNSALAWNLSALTLAYVGRSQEAIQRAEHALRLSPLDSGAFFYHAVLGWAYYAGSVPGRGVTSGSLV